MEITWQTEISELVDVETVVGYVEDTESTVKGWVNPRIDALELEMIVGGLSQEALLFNGESPLFDEAKRIKTAYEDKLAQFSELEKEVRTKTRNKRREELLKLQTAVQAEYDRQSELKNHYLSQKAEADENGGSLTPSYHGAYSYSLSSEGIQDKIDDCNEMITTLGEKLKLIETELQKL